MCLNNIKRRIKNDNDNIGNHVSPGIRSISNWFAELWHLAIATCHCSNIHNQDIENDSEKGRKAGRCSHGQEIF